MKVQFESRSLNMVAAHSLACATPWVNLHSNIHIKSRPNSANYHLNSKWRMTGLLSQQDLGKRIRVFIFRGLDCCRGVFPGLCEKSGKDQTAAAGSERCESPHLDQEGETHQSVSQIFALCVKELILDYCCWFKKHRTVQGRGQSSTWGRSVQFSWVTYIKQTPRKPKGLKEFSTGWALHSCNIVRLMMDSCFIRRIKIGASFLAPCIPLPDPNLLPTLPTMQLRITIYPIWYAYDGIF